MASQTVSVLRRLLSDNPGGTRARIAGIYALLLSINAIAWVFAFLLFASQPILLGTALLAYTFGLRHAVDADHIAAIDNVTRKLMQEGKRPVGVGFFFSLGHSTIVFALSAAIALAVTTVKHNLPGLQSIGGLVGTAVSAVFLFVIAIVNVFVLIDVARTFREVKRGGTYSEAGLDDILGRRGLLGRIFHPLLKLVGSSRGMYPVGVLFGLGFDTATEIGLLGIAAIAAGKALPMYAILLFPLLFTAGMSLVDTTDGVLMLGAYGWAFVNPVRKLYYNMNITLVSVLVAIVVGSIEALGAVAGAMALSGPFWSALANLNRNFEELGFLIVGIFVASWGASTLVYRLRRYDRINAVAKK